MVDNVFVIKKKKKETRVKTVDDSPLSNDTHEVYKMYVPEELGVLLGYTTQKLHSRTDPKITRTQWVLRKRVDKTNPTRYSL